MCRVTKNSKVANNIIFTVFLTKEEKNYRINIIFQMS